MGETYTAANRDLWDRWTRLHMDPQSDYAEPLARLKSGGTTLGEIELRELGSVEGKALLHLQCHFGLDTLSWAREGALVTGVDFSPEAIALARSLSAELGIEADFICCDVYDLPAMLDSRFDVVFTSHGVLAWLPDLTRWGQVIARFLKPGGTFYIVEGHPIRRLLLPRPVDDTGKPIDYGYFPRVEPVRVEERGSYARPEADVLCTAHYWSHGLGEIATALCAAGLRLEYLHEFPKTVEDCCAWEEIGPGQFEPRLCHNVAIPGLFSIRATRPV